MLAEWSDFCVAQVGASAALLGLRFVGVSINLGRILTLAGLPDRALLALVLILNVLVTATLMLVPGQPLRLLGAEVLIAGTVVWGVGTRLQSRAFRGNPDRNRAATIGNLLLLEFAALPFVVAGVALLLGYPAGLYGIVAGILASFIKAVADAWVLLIEINR